MSTNTNTDATFTPGPWRWIYGENGEGFDSWTLVGSPDEWKRCEHFCFGWKEGSPHSRGPLSTPGHEHNHAPTVLSASGWHGSGDLVIDIPSPDANLIAAAPEQRPDDYRHRQSGGTPMTYTILSEHPTRFEIEQPSPCEDCNEPVTILTDTIAGYLCDECSQRFHGAARGLAKRRTA